MGPAFQLVVGRAKSVSLERFREEVSKALTGEVQSGSTARHRTQHFVTNFNEECKGMCFIAQKIKATNKY